MPNARKKGLAHATVYVDGAKLDALDELGRRKGYGNRAAFIRAIIVEAATAKGNAKAFDSLLTKR